METLLKVWGNNKQLEKHSPPQHFSFSETSTPVSITREKSTKCFLFLNCYLQMDLLWSLTSSTMSYQYCTIVVKRSLYVSAASPKDVKKDVIARPQWIEEPCIARNKCQKLSSILHVVIQLSDKVFPTISRTEFCLVDQSGTKPYDPGSPPPGSGVTAV